MKLPIVAGIGEHPVWLGAILALLLVSVFWMIYRLYKHIGRRCRGCGAIFGVKRTHKIHLAGDENISILAKKDDEGIVWYRRLRWWIRRVTTRTFSICKCGRSELVKTGSGPISVFHAYFVKIFHPSQFLPDSRLDNVSHFADLDQRNIGKFLLCQSELDRPPFRIFARKPKERVLKKTE